MRRATARAVLLCSLVVATGALVARPIRRLVGAFWSEFRAFRPRRGPVLPPNDAAELGLRPTALSVGGVGAIRGWSTPSRNGAAVVLTHGLGGDRREVLDVARALARGGYGTLLLDWPGHGESDGRVRFGEPERRALTAAVDHLARRPDVVGGRVGVYGFSMGGFVAAQVAAVDARVRAVVLAAPPGDVVAHTRHEYAAGGRAAQWGALLGNRAAGLRLDEPQPMAVVRQIAPRPLLILTGTEDRTVTPAAVRALYATAEQPKRLWLVERAGHGRYEGSAPGYGVEIRRFFDAALAAPGRVQPARRAAPTAERR